MAFVSPFSFLSGLRARLILLLALAVLPWAAITAYGLWEDWHKARADAIDHVQALTAAVAREQQRLVEDTRTLLGVLAVLPEVAEGDAAGCAKRLVQLDLRARGYLNVGVIGPDGVALCDLLGGAGTYLGDREYFRAARTQGRFVAGGYIIGRISGKPTFPLAHPVRDQSGTVRRVIYAAFDTRWLENMLAASPLPAGMVVTLMDRHGTVLARVPPRPDLLGKPHPARALIAVLETASKPGVVETVAEEKSIIAYAPLAWEGQPLAHVAASVPTAVIEAPLKAAFLTRGALLFLVILGVFALAWVLAEKLVRAPVRAMRDLAHRLEAGDLPARSGVKLGGEVGELAHSLDAMAVALQKSRLQLERIMDVAPEGILLTDAHGRIVLANARCQSLFGYTAEELVGQSIEILLPEDRREAHVGERAAYLAAPRVREMGTPGLDLKARHKDGTVFPVDVSLGPLRTDDGLWVVAVVRDVSERKAFEAEILRQATHDALTGLPNRMLFRELLQQAMVQADRDETLLAVMFLDLDGFKTINDTLGHGAGDALLVQVAERIRNTLRASDVVARQGGDEFTLLLSGVRHMSGITRICEKLLAAIARPYEIEAREVNVTASIGITLYPIDDADTDHLLRNADTAMYRAKHDGRNRYAFFTAEMNAEVRTRLEIETGLRRALREEQFEVFYQPQVAVDTGRWVALEALIRWRHPERGLVPPAEFIPVAEDSGLIEPIGEWVLAQVCRQINEWRRRGLPPLRVGVNLSARQFAKSTLVDDVAAILAGQGMGPCASQIELEVTESMLMGDWARSAALLRAFRDMGLALAIDDFGTGYSSLSYLKRFPLTALKIDRSFIDGVVDDADDAAIARAIIELAHNLRLAVVAEGVETAEQWQWLREHGCDLAQGYFFGRPMPAAEIEAHLTGEQTALRSAL